MADVFGMNVDVQGGLTTGYWGILIVLCIVLFFGLGFAYIWYKKYNRIVVVKKMVSDGKKKVMFDKCRYLKDKEGVEWFKFLYLRKKVRLPPSEAIEIMASGKEFLECYLTETGEISWAKDNTKELKGIEPFTTEDRQVLQYQFYKAHLEGGVNWKDLIIPIVGIMALVIIIVCLLIFYKDMGEPLLAMADKVNLNTDKQIQLMDKMNIMLERLCAEGYGNCTQVLTSNHAVRVAPS